MTTFIRRFPALHATRTVSISFLLFLCCGLLLAEDANDQSGKVDDYNQWKLATADAGATGAADIETLSGFKVELLRSARPEEGSWVSLAFDPQGRLTIAREDQGLLRLTPPQSAAEAIQVETINETLEECRGLLYAFDSLYANANNSKGFYRLRDTNGDDRFDEVKLLRATPGGVGHGRNDLVLGPDDRIYLIHGNDTLLPGDFEPGASPLRNFAVDRLLPCKWNGTLFNAGVLPPAGHVIRTDKDGRTWELVAGGFRNPFGIDFNPEGEMFTYDADMEWDAGAPWYRPTRVNHIVSGGDYGWRQGTGKFPAFFPDSLPAVLDIGLGSPTAVQFGTRSNFPPRYRRALFILDWAYGRIFAVHLTPQGASYTAVAEVFVKGRPLNVTDVAFGPDGAMYFTTGGRRTQAGLYRVSYVGAPLKDEPLQYKHAAQANVEQEKAASARALRNQLEAFHGREDAGAVEAAWPHLNDPDRWIRHAARVALEHQPVETWQARALKEDRPLAAATALMALARIGDKNLQPAILGRLGELPLDQFPPEERLTACRAHQLCFTRMGRPADTLAAEVAAKLDTLFPSDDPRINQLLCELLVYLESLKVVEKTLPLLASANSQEEKLHYLFTLRNVKDGWSLDARKTYFRFLQQARQFDGARYMPVFIRSITDDALTTLSDPERKLIDAILAEPDPAAAEPLPPAENRPLVRKWQLDDLTGSLGEVDRGRSFEQGRRMFDVALCSRCHKLAGHGQSIGPDLTEVARRFSRRDLLESILAPSKVVGEKYRNTVIITGSGRVLVGSLVGGDEMNVLLARNPLDPSQTVKIAKSEIESQQASLVSPMPPGALDTLTKEEILDLLAYIEARSQPDHSNFQP